MFGTKIKPSRRLRKALLNSLVSSSCEYEGEVGEDGDMRVKYDGLRIHAERDNYTIVFTWEGMDVSEYAFKEAIYEGDIITLSGLEGRTRFSID